MLAWRCRPEIIINAFLMQENDRLLTMLYPQEIDVKKIMHSNTLLYGVNKQ